jgi:uncharacterized protein (DUF58 family)
MGKFWWTMTGLLALTSVLLRYNLLFLLSLFLALIGGVSLWWARTCLVGVSYRRSFESTRLFYGEEIDFGVEIVNAKPLPLAWLRAEDEAPEALDFGAAKLSYSHRPRRRLLVNLLSLRWYERVTRHYRLRAVRRGAWQFGPVEIASGDIFGFDIRRASLPDTEFLLVYPKIVPLTALGLPALRPFGDLRTPQRLLEDPLRLTGAREYAPGDSFRHIHWKATARRPSLQTKVFDPSATRPLAIFLNINTFELAYEGIDPDLQEYAVSAAASIAHWATDNHHAVGLYVNSMVQPGGRRIAIRPGSRSEQLTHILEALAMAISYGPWSIQTILQLEAPRLSYGASIVVVTATMNDRLRSILFDLKSRQYGVTLITLGQAGEGFFLPGVQHYHIGGRKEWHDLTSLALVA